MPHSFTSRRETVWTPSSQLMSEIFLYIACPGDARFNCCQILAVDCISLQIRGFQAGSSVTFDSNFWHSSLRRKHMRQAAIVFALTLVSCLAAQTPAAKKHSENSSGVIVYAEGGAFQIEGPTGWVADRETGQQLGGCCVFYPKGSTFDDAETILYP